MKIQWGMMMTDGRGKLGGQVASKNRAGAYVRTRVTPSNPQTTPQGMVRSILSVLSKKWSESLSDIQRKQWNTGASSGVFAKTDVFGNSRNPSGFNLFVGMNSLQQATGGRHIVTPPRKANFLEVKGIDLEVQEGATSTMQANFNLENGTVQPGTKLQVQATTMVSPGKSYAKNLFRLLSVFDAEPGNNTLALADDYEARFGSIVGNEGKQVFVRVRQVVDGQPTPWVTTSAIVQPATP